MRDHELVWFRVGDDNLAELLAEAARRGYTVEGQPKVVLKDDGSTWHVYDVHREI